MAIKNLAGEKVSAKEAVEEIFAGSIIAMIATIKSGYPAHDQIANATDREKVILIDQATKIGERLLKKLRYDVGHDAVEAAVDKAAA